MDYTIPGFIVFLIAWDRGDYYCGQAEGLDLHGPQCLAEVYQYENRAKAEAEAARLSADIEAWMLRGDTYTMQIPIDALE